MNEFLKNTIQIVKEKLKHEPNGIILGDLKDGNKKVVNGNVYVSEYYDFLKESDGARCGSIDFWSYDELPLNQFRVIDLHGGNEVWIEIGQILYEPLVINKHDGNVYLFKEDKPNDMSLCFGKFDSFLLNYVFGKKYEEIVPDSHLEKWYQFLKGIGLA